MSIKKLLNSFKFAGEGLVAIFKSEQNFRIEVVGFGVVVILMFVLPLTILERVALGMVGMNVLIMEIMNTVLEYLLDMNSKRKNKKVKFLKDVMAGAVLLSAILAIVVGIVIFGGYFLE